MKPKIKKNKRSHRGLVHRKNIFLKANKVQTVPFGQSPKVLKISGYSVKKILKILLASLKTLINSEDCSERRSRISVPCLLCPYWSIFSTVQKSEFQSQNLDD